MFSRRTVLLAASALPFAASALAQTATSTLAPRETNVIDTLATVGGYRRFIGLAQASGAVEFLRGGGPFILLAPSDAALDLLPQSVLAAFMPAQSGSTTPSTDLVRLSAFVNSHIIEGTGSLATQRGRTVTMRTRNGNGVEFSPADNNAIRVVSTGDGGFGAGGINIEPRNRVVMSEIIATNGVIWPVSLPFLL